MLGWRRWLGVRGRVIPGDVDERAALDGPGPARPSGDASIPGAGPYDVEDVPTDDIRRLDAGSVLLPVLAGVEYRFCTEGSGGRVAAVVAVAGDSSMEVSVFAAPTSGGLWDEVREQLYRSERVSSAGRATVTDGRRGPELVLTASGADPHDSRIVGIDGRRWMLRAVISGPAAEPRGSATLLDDLLTHAVVLRGEHALPVGAPLPLRLPGDTELTLDPDLRSDPGSAPGPADDPLGRVRPTGTASADARRVSYEVISAPPGGLSRNLTTWG